MVDATTKGNSMHAQFKKKHRECTSQQRRAQNKKQTKNHQQCTKQYSPVRVVVVVVVVVVGAAMDEQTSSSTHRRNTATSLHHGKWSSAATVKTHGSIKHRTECPEPGEQKTSKNFKD